MGRWFSHRSNGPGASSRLAHLAVCCRHRCLGRQPKKSGKTLQMGVVTAQASLGLASCPRGHPSSVHSEHSRRRRGANGEARPVTLRCCPLRCSPPASSTDSTAERLGSAGGATRGLCCGHLGRRKRRQPAARPRILHTRRHDRDERARCRVLVQAACEGRLWPQQVHQTDLKACRRRAVVARARDRCRGSECSGDPEATWVTKWWNLPILSRAVLWWGCV